MTIRLLEPFKMQAVSFLFGVIPLFALMGCVPKGQMPYEYPNSKWTCDEVNAWFIVDPAHDTIYYGRIMIDGKIVEVGFGVGPGNGGAIFEFSLVNTDDKMSGPKECMWSGKVSYQENKFVLIESDINKVFDEGSFPITFIREDLDEQVIRAISPWGSNGNLKE